MQSSSGNWNLIALPVLSFLRHRKSIQQQQWSAIWGNNNTGRRRLAVNPSNICISIIKSAAYMEVGLVALNSHELKLFRQTRWTIGSWFDLKGITLNEEPPVHCSCSTFSRYIELVSEDCDGRAYRQSECCVWGRLPCLLSIGTGCIFCFYYLLVVLIAVRGVLLIYYILDPYVTYIIIKRSRKELKKDMKCKVTQTKSLKLAPKITEIFPDR